MFFRQTCCEERAWCSYFPFLKDENVICQKSQATWNETIVFFSFIAFFSIEKQFALLKDMLSLVKFSVLQSHTGQCQFPDMITRFIKIYIYIQKI